MARGDRRHGGAVRRWLRRIALLVVVALLAVAGAGVWAWQTDHLDEVRDRVERALGRTEPTTPAAIAAPPGLDLPPVTPAPAVATPVDPATTTADPAAVRRAVAPWLRDRDLGSHVLGLVSDLATGQEVWRRGSGAATPASTTKLLTAAAALQAIGPEARFTTKVVAGGPGTVVLVGGGDPFLERAPADPADPDSAPSYPARADLTTLAQQTAATLLAAGTTSVQLGYDDSLFPGPTASAGWRADYLPDGVVAPVTALWTDEGRPLEGTGRVADPSLAAAQDFAAALTAAGVAVTGVPAKGVASPTGQVLGSVQGAPLREVVERVLEVSDNEGAEVLAHQVAVARGLPGTFTDGVSAVLATLGELGITTTGIELHDGSGLSRQNRIEPAVLVAVLRAAADPTHPRLASMLGSLPVAGFTGSLTDRFAAVPAAGRGVVRAKTGTLTGVGSLAGVAVDATGHEYAFVLMADRVGDTDELEAEAALDGAAGALGACTCSTATG